MRAFILISVVSAFAILALAPRWSRAEDQTREETFRALRSESPLLNEDAHAAQSCVEVYIPDRGVTVSAVFDPVSGRPAGRIKARYGKPFHVDFLARCRQRGRVELPPAKEISVPVRPADELTRLADLAHSLEAETARVGDLCARASVFVDEAR